VLWIDDDLVRRHYALPWLSSEGFTVETASNGKEALDLARQRPFDVIVLDECVPGLSSLQVLRTLKAEGIKVPVMILTAFGNARFGAEATRCGAVACYDKPLVGSDLVEALVHIGTGPPAKTGLFRSASDLWTPASVMAVLGHLANLEELYSGRPVGKGADGRQWEPLTSSLAR
jgi:CheY-like chemotaxis protein